jgi:hypothetical protein
MADIVIGVASSHTPQLSSGVDMWFDHAERDRRNPLLLGKDARYHTYNELLAEADPALAEELTPAVWDRKYQRCQDAIEALTACLDDAHADIAVVIGDDQRELFRDDGIPAFACFAGTELVDMPPSRRSQSDAPDLSNCLEELNRWVTEYGFAAAYVSPDPGRPQDDTGHARIVLVSAVCARPGTGHTPDRARHEFARPPVPGGPA